MKWIGISGSWRKSSPELERDLHSAVESILDNDDGIVAGGALGVDFIATELALQRYPDGSHVKVILPTSLEIYSAHYQRRAEEGVITPEQAENLIRQLETINSLGSLVTNNTNTEVNVDTYYQRNMEVVAASDELRVYQVNGSAGTQDALEKAEQRGIPVEVLRYEVA